MPIYFILLFLMIMLVQNYEMIAVSVTSTNYYVNQNGTYSIYMDRTYDSQGNSISNPPNVPAGSNVTVTFPSDYNSTSFVSATCTSPSSCTFSGTTLTITGLYSTDTAVSNVTVVIINVLNPPSARQTGQFLGSIGLQYTLPNNGTLNTDVIPINAGNFTSCSITFSNSVVNKSSNMIITVVTGDPVTAAGGSFYLTLPQYYWTNDIKRQTVLGSSVIGCTNGSSNTSPSMSCVFTTTTINFTNIFSSDIGSNVSFTLIVNNVISPPTLQPSDSIILGSYLYGNQVDGCNSTISNLTPATLGISVTNTSSFIVNKNVTLKITVTLVDFVPYTDTYIIMFPNSLKVFNTSFSGQSYTVSSAALVNSTSSTQTTNLTWSQTVPQNKTLSNTTVMNYTLSSVLAPSTTQTTSAITVGVLSNGYFAQTGTFTLTASASSVSFTVTPLIYTINSNTTYLFVIVTSDTISSSGRIRIDFPNTVSLSISSSCASASGTNINSSPTCTQSGSYSIYLTNLNASSSLITATTISINITGIINPSTTQPTSSFTITTYYSTSDSTLVATTTSNSITATSGSISSASASITASSYLVSDTTVTYIFVFNTTNTVPAGGAITLGIPNTIIVNTAAVSSYCSYKLSSAAASFSSDTCSYTTNSSFYFITFNTLLQSTSLAAGSQVTLQLASMFTNPPSTQAVSGFTITTYSNFSQGYIIDRLASGLSLKMTIPADFTAVKITATNTTNSAITTYLFNFTQKSTIASGSYLNIYFPTQISITSTPVCVDYNSVTVTCTLSSQVLMITFASSASGNTSFTFTISNIQNGPSLAPSSNFGFETKLSDNVSYYCQNLSKLSITNTQASGFSSLSYSFSNQTLKANQVLTILMTPSSNITGYALLTLAPSFTLTSTYACLTSSMSFTAVCSGGGASNSSLKITGFQTATLTTLVFNGFTSPSSIPNDYTILSTYDINNYMIDQKTTSIQFSLLCSLPCMTCSGTTSNCTSCYNDTTITNSIYYNSVSNTCGSTCPAQYYANSTTFQCSSCNTNCYNCSMLASNCTSCQSSNYLNVSTGVCLTTCPTYFYGDSTQTPAVCVACVSPCSTCTSSTVCLTCANTYYYYNSTCITTCPATTTIQNNNTNTCDSCNAACATCSVITTNCTSCSSSAALYNGSCVLSCPTPLVISSGLCVSCTSPCSTCNTTSTNCTSCLSNTTTPLLLNNSCVSTCPTYYYNITASGSCLSCSGLSLNCNNCINSSACSTCNSGYVLITSTALCSSTVPQGYANISGVAVACTNGCATCSGTTSFCLSCSTLYLYANTCISTCPVGYVPVNLVCTLCSSPCATCSGISTSCLTCLTNLSSSYYLSGTSCVTSCPSGTYGDPTTLSCLACVSPCSTCTSNSSCLSCVTGYNLYQTSCLAACPSGYVGVNSICLSCTSPCATCSNIQSNCTSCLSSSNTYYTPYTCVTSANCPSSTYANVTYMNCSSCSFPCATCSAISTCLTCVTNYNLLNNTCSSSCTTGYVAINSVCYQCTTPCSTCFNTQTNCTACLSSTGLYLTSNSCVNSSSCPVGTYANSTNLNCATCNSLCTSCLNYTFCSGCVTNYYLFNGTCSTTCPGGYYTFSQTCLACSSPCATCNSTSTSCLSCLAGLGVYLTGSQCVSASACPTGSYANATNSICTTCNSTCFTCSSSTVCLSCASGYYLYNSTCISTCPTGYLISGSSCQACTSPCSTCSTSLSTCTSCLSSQVPAVYLSGTQCVIASLCPTGTYANTTNNNCSSCVSPCQTCSDSLTCLSCVSNYYLYSTTCLTSCPVGYLGVGTSCTVCTSPCATCSISLTNCTSCSTSTSPSVYLSGNNCVVSSLCPSGTYPNITLNMCSTCILPCLVCNSSSICLQCNSSYNLLNNACTSNCNNNQIPINSVCTNCTSPCLTCVTYVNYCLSCNTSTIYIYLSSNRCVSVCPDTYYANTTSYVCTSCTSPCYTCSSSTLCLTCVSGYYLYQSGCTQTCPSGYGPSNLICSSCTSPCLTCSASLTTCLSCVSTYYLSGTYCLSTCPSTTYANSTTGLCTSCVVPCSTCTTTSSCLSCSSNYYLYNVTSCLSTCPLGYLNINGVCSVCDISCKTCENQTTTCLTCSTSYYFYNYGCSLTCLDGLYPDGASQTCLSCVSPCKTCTSSTLCKTCLSGVYYQQSCPSSCPSTYYAINSICVSCPTGCSVCSSNSICSSCVSNYYLYGSLCIITCPNAYAVVVNGVCTACSASNCTSCTSSDYCLSCSSPLLVYLGNCLLACPTNYSSNGTSCVLNNSTNTTTNTTLVTSLSNSKIFPLPFTIASIVVLIICCVSKFQNINTFLAAGVYSMMGILEWGVFMLFGFLYIQRQDYVIDNIFLAICASAGTLYIVNILNLVAILCVLRQDSKFKYWMNQTCSTKAIYVVSSVFSVLFSHKFINIMFSRLFNFIAFRAILESVTKFFWFNFMSVLSLIHAISAVAIAAYVGYSISDLTNQTYIESIDVVVVTVITFIFALANAHKDEDFFDDKSTQKKVGEQNDEFINENFDISNVESEREVGAAGGAYTRHEDVSSQSQIEQHISEFPLAHQEVPASQLNLAEPIQNKQQPKKEALSELTLSEQENQQVDQPKVPTANKYKDMVSCSIQAQSLIDDYEEAPKIPNIFDPEQVQRGSQDNLLKNNHRMNSMQSSNRQFTYVDRPLTNKTEFRERKTNFNKIKEDRMKSQRLRIIDTQKDSSNKHKPEHTPSPEQIKEQSMDKIIFDQEVAPEQPAQIFDEVIIIDQSMVDSQVNNNDIKLEEQNSKIQQKYTNEKNINQKNVNDKNLNQKNANERNANQDQQQGQSLKEKQLELARIKKLIQEQKMKNQLKKLNQNKEENQRKPIVNYTKLEQYSFDHESAVQKSNISSMSNKDPKNNISDISNKEHKGNISIKESEQEKIKEKKNEQIEIKKKVKKHERLISKDRLDKSKEESLKNNNNSIPNQKNSEFLKVINKKPIGIDDSNRSSILNNESVIEKNLNNTSNELEVKQLLDSLNQNQQDSRNFTFNHNEMQMVQNQEKLSQEDITNLKELKSEMEIKENNIEIIYEEQENKQQKEDDIYGKQNDSEQSRNSFKNKKKSFKMPKSLETIQLKLEPDHSRKNDQQLETIDQKGFIVDNQIEKSEISQDDLYKQPTYYQNVKTHKRGKLNSQQGTHSSVRYKAKTIINQTKPGFYKSDNKLSISPQKEKIFKKMKTQLKPNEEQSIKKNTFAYRSEDFDAHKDKFNLMYDTSELEQGQSIEGISPSDFNAYNQRYDEPKNEKSKIKKAVKNDLPTKPQILLVGSKQFNTLQDNLEDKQISKIELIPDINSIMRQNSNYNKMKTNIRQLANLQQQVNDQQQHNKSGEISRRSKKSPKRNKQLERIYLQRLDIPQRSRSKSRERSKQRK